MPTVKLSPAEFAIMLAILEKALHAASCDVDNHETVFGVGADRRGLPHKNLDALQSIEAKFVDAETPTACATVPVTT